MNMSTAPLQKGKTLPVRLPVGHDALNEKLVAEQSVTWQHSNVALIELDRQSEKLDLVIPSTKMIAPTIFVHVLVTKT